MVVYIDDLVSAGVVVVVVVAGDIVRVAVSAGLVVVSALVWATCCWVEEMRMSPVPGGNVGDLWRDCMGGGEFTLLPAADSSGGL